MKVAIVVDSSCGLTEKQAHDLGWFYLPIQIEIDSKIYQDGVDIDAQSVFEHIKSNSKTHTSSSNIQKAIEVVTSLKGYDKILIYPISTYLSGQYASLKNLFENVNPVENVYVVESKKISHAIILDLLKFQREIDNGSSFENAIKIFDAPQEKTLLIPQENEALVRGGRLTPAAASVAKLLKIVPIIEMKDGKLEKYAKGRVFDKCLVKYSREVVEDKKPDTYLLFNNASNNEIETHVKNILVENDQEIGFIFPMPPTISIHTGKGAITMSYIHLDNYLINKIEKITKTFKK